MTHGIEYGKTRHETTVRLALYLLLCVCVTDDRGVDESLCDDLISLISMKDIKLSCHNDQHHFFIQIYV